MKLKVVDKKGNPIDGAKITVTTPKQITAEKWHLVNTHHNEYLLRNTTDGTIIFFDKIVRIPGVHTALFLEGKFVGAINEAELPEAIRDELF